MKVGEQGRYQNTKPIWLSLLLVSISFVQKTASSSQLFWWYGCLYVETSQNGPYLFQTPLWWKRKKTRTWTREVTARGLCHATRREPYRIVGRVDNWTGRWDTIISHWFLKNIVLYNATVEIRRYRWKDPRRIIITGATGQGRKSFLAQIIF